MRCDAADQSAPRVGCDCRSCYVMRERSLDPRLIELARENHRDFISPARHILHRCLDTYVMGRIEWAALHVEIIEALVKLSDDQYKRELALAMASKLVNPPQFMAKPTKDNDWMAA